MSVVFQPVTLGTLQLRNRVVRSATQNYLGHPDGAISRPEIRLRAGSGPASGSGGGDGQLRVL